MLICVTNKNKTPAQQCITQHYHTVNVLMYYFVMAFYYNIYLIILSVQPVHLSKYYIINKLYRAHYKYGAVSFYQLSYAHFFIFLKCFDCIF